MGADTDQIRAEVLRVHKEVAQDPDTAVAAFGIACAILRDALNCNLKVAVALLECWLKEATPRTPP